jgi:hypothetical protein
LVGNPELLLDYGAADAGSDGGGVLCDRVREGDGAE